MNTTMLKRGNFEGQTRANLVKPASHQGNVFLAVIASLLLISCGSSNNGSDASDPTNPTVDESKVEQVCNYQPKETSCPSCDPLPTFSPAEDGKLATAIKVEDYGAIGNGEQRDHSAIQAAIDAAGSNGTIVFQGGKTYLICQMLRAKQGQLWTRIGAEPATIKRCDTPVARLTQSASIGDTTVQVDTSSGFEAGMWISPVKASGNAFDDGEIIHHPVTNVSPNTIVFYNGLGKSYSTGDKLVTSFAMVHDNENNVTFEGLEFDGNRAGNDHFVSWARHSTLWFSNENSIVRNSSFINSQGDALTIQGSNNLVEFNSFNNLNGSALHFSSAIGATARQNTITNTNEQFERVVHAEAAVTWSLGNQNITIENNCIQNSGSAVFGKIAFHGSNKGASITGNKICNASKLLWALTTENLEADLTFSNNTAVNAGIIDIYALSNMSLSNIRIENNTLLNSIVSLDQVNDVTVAGNHFEISAQSELNSTVSESTDGMLTVIGSRNVDISNNFISGGTKGLFVRDSSTIGSGIKLKGNSFTGQTHEAMTLGYIPTLENGSSANNNYVVENNLVCEKTMASLSTAVYLPPGTQFTNNCVLSNERAIAPFGHSASTTLQKLSLSNNVIISDGVNFDLRNGLVHDIDLDNNTLSQTVPTELLVGTNSNQGNVVDPSKLCTLDTIATPN